MTEQRRKTATFMVRDEHGGVFSVDEFTNEETVLNSQHTFRTRDYLLADGVTLHGIKVNLEFYDSRGRRFTRV